MYPHRIRLRGPWQIEPHAESGNAVPPFTVSMPCTWSEMGLGSFRGMVRLRRSFGMPRRLDSWERIWLTGADVHWQTDVFLNDEQLGTIVACGQPISLEITGKLRERNEVCLVTQLDVPGATVGHDLALEIRAAAWLDQVHSQLTLADAQSELTIRGRAYGASPTPVDAFVIVGRHVAHQTRVEPTESGRHFEWKFTLTASDTVHAEHGLISVELVQGSAIWYRIEQRPEMAAS